MSKKNNSNQAQHIKSPYVSKYVQSNYFLVSYPKHSTNSSMKDYSTSYQSTVDAILEPITKKGYTDPIDDLLLLPVLFLWRQVIEIELKRFLYILDFRINNNNTFETHHDLEKLYVKIVPLIKLSNLPKGVTSKFRGFKSLIDFYHFYDPGSYSFRYPQDLKQNITIFNQDQQYIDIELLYKDIKGLVDLISFCEYTLDQLHESVIA